jgi:hypothetical protein
MDRPLYKCSYGFSMRPDTKPFFSYTALINISIKETTNKKK